MLDRESSVIGFRFPVLAAWKPESQWFQRLAWVSGAVSGHISYERWKPNFCPRKPLIKMGFRFPDFPPPTGAGYRKADRPQGPCPQIHNRRCRQ